MLVAAINSFRLLLNELTRWLARLMGKLMIKLKIVIPAIRPIPKIRIKNSPKIADFTLDSTISIRAALPARP